MKTNWMEMSPVELDEAVGQCPMLYLPVGSLEWHGPHSPLGTDAYRAQALCEAAVARTGGVMAPMLYVAAPGFPAYGGSVFFSPDLVIRMIEEIRREVRKVGFRVLVQITAHCGRAQQYCFTKAFEGREDEDGLITITDNGIAPVEGLGGAHAGSLETAQTMASAPAEAIQLDKYAPAETALPRYENHDPEAYLKGAPPELREHIRMTLARREWPNFEDNLVDLVTAPGAAEKAFEAGIERIVTRARAALDEARERFGR